MATVYITDWEEFTNALVNDITEDTTYEIQNDIDASSTPIESVISITGNKTSSSEQFTKTFNGNGHKIDGITSYLNNTNSSLIMFDLEYVSSAARYGHNFIFNDIHFTNIMSESIGLFTFHGYSHGSLRTTYTFNRCFFSGLCYRLFYSDGDVSGGATLNKCSVNAKVYSYCNGTVQHNYCYCLINPYRATCSWGSYGYYNSIITQANNSYFGGKIIQNYDTNNYVFLIGISRAGYNSKNNNVLNYDIVISNYSASVNYQITGSTSLTTDGNSNLINSSRIYQSDGTTQIPSSQITNGSGNYLLTDTQMKSKQYIQNNTEFPLY